MFQVVLQTQNNIFKTTRKVRCNFEKIFTLLFKRIKIHLYRNFTYFGVNVEIFQKIIMDNTNISKQIYEERRWSVKQNIVLQYNTENVASNSANVLAWITHPDSQNEVEQQWGICNI